MAREKHLYRGKGGRESKKEFEERYGKEHGNYVYGATVAKVKREQMDSGTYHKRTKRNKRRRK